MVTSKSSSFWSGSALNTRPLLYSEKLRVAVQLLLPRVTRWPHRRWNMSNAGHRVSVCRASLCRTERDRWVVVTDMPGAPRCAAHRIVALRPPPLRRRVRGFPYFAGRNEGARESRVHPLSSTLCTSSLINDNRDASRPFRFQFPRVRSSLLIFLSFCEK